MKVVNLNPRSSTYTSNAYLVTGTWNTLEDVNTLVDVGRDLMMLDRLAEANVGVGQLRVAQVILTHDHYDHISLLPEIRQLYQPTVYAFLPFHGVDRVLRNGDRLKMGDHWFDVLHMPSHSHDSICLFCEQEGVLFSGDTTILINNLEGTIEEFYLQGLSRLADRNVNIIYPGHGSPLTGDISARISQGLAGLRRQRQ